MGYNISTTKTETYKIRWKGEGYGYWADITLDPNETGGRIQIASDFGNWQSYWGSTGKCDNSFKRFLCRIDIEYTAGKFGCSRYFYKDATLDMWEQQYNEDPFTDQEKHKEFQEEMNVMREEAPSDNGGFFTFVYSNCPTIISYFERPDTLTGIEPRFKSFWKHMWPVFIEQIKQELSAIDAKTLEVQP